MGLFLASFAEEARVNKLAVTNAKKKVKENEANLKQLEEVLKKVEIDKVELRMAKIWADMILLMINAKLASEKEWSKEVEAKAIKVEMKYMQGS